ncbi:hypothetical protein L3X38_025217 [Prunus dulcis]|uniref:Uncharacterized protein n=1 Tax=Prunus dulcis TaxID=3755 RepID=A0AAD4W176_PRUDU|nr:hypothetical protein L3X38_025217 [Prunus dulcis]
MFAFEAKGKDGNGTPIVIRRGSNIITTGAVQTIEPTWQDKSKRNKSNRAKSTIVHTTSFVPMEKYRKDELDRTGIEPSRIDCFKKLHVSKPKNGGEESLSSEKAKELFENNSNTYAGSRQSASTDNVESCLDAHLEDEYYNIIFILLQYVFRISRF